MNDQFPPHICPNCRMAILNLIVTIPAQRGTVELDVPEGVKPVMNMGEVGEPVFTCPKCRQPAPQETLNEWKVEVSEI